MTTQQKFLEIAQDAALQGGKILQNYWGKISGFETKQTSSDLVTIADKAAEEAIVKCLIKAFADHKIIGEEQGMHGNKDSEYAWIIDPLDGTTNYAHHFPHCAVSIGLFWQNTPFVAVVYNPFTGEMYQAAKGQGAFLNGAKLHVTSTAELGKSLLATGFPYYRNETKDNNYREFCHFTALSHGVRRVGAASLDFAAVAAGRFDGYWEQGLQPWDMAAGMLLVTEAGGKLTAYDGSPVKVETGRVVATNGLIHDQMIQELKACSTAQVI